MKRSPIGLDEITDFHNLAAAFHTAARGKRGRPEVEAFRRNLGAELTLLRSELLTGAWQPATMRSFPIRDPKPRTIHAPAFRDRVAHHAIMAHVGPVLDRVLVYDSYACRLGKGALAAVQRARAHSADYQWYCQIDIRAYFASIDHDILLRQLCRRFRDRQLLSLLDRIVRCHTSTPGKGLPIGTLPSQHFANFHLAEADRVLLETCRVSGFVRYMDDLVWWGDTRQQVRDARDTVLPFMACRLGLEAKQPARVARSETGLNFLGFQILPYGIKLSRRRRRRYAAMRRDAESAALSGKMRASGLQAAYTSALSLTAHADAVAWRRGQLLRVPVEPLLDVL